MCRHSFIFLTTSLACIGHSVFYCRNGPSNLADAAKEKVTGVVNEAFDKLKK